MGQAGAQREPSMEEILASIRRIIENNEPALDGGDGEANAHHFDGDDVYRDDDAQDEAQYEVENDEPAIRPVTLAEVAALARSVPKEPEPQSDEQAPADEAPDSAEIDHAAAAELRDALLSDDPVEAAESPDTDLPVESAVTVETAQAEAGQSGQSGQSVHKQHIPEPQVSGGQLVSLHTGEKVAAAFGELDAAIAAGQSRSFDEIAEEMLRPMLTQWLDDNLPTLVERLVREEIERVSRGNRR